MLDIRETEAAGFPSVRPDVALTMLREGADVAEDVGKRITLDRSSPPSHRGYVQTVAHIHKLLAFGERQSSQHTLPVLTVVSDVSSSHAAEGRVHRPLSRHVSA